MHISLGSTTTHSSTFFSSASSHLPRSGVHNHIGWDAAHLVGSRDCFGSGIFKQQKWLISWDFYNFDPTEMMI
jgi:hypothetical protein